MPSPSTSRRRRSRAPSPESQRATEGDILAKVAKGVLAYSLNHYLTRQLSTPASQTSSQSARYTEDMPSKRSPSRSDQSRAFGFSSSSSRRDDPTHELISHLLRGAAALAARHWMKNRKKDKDKSSKPKPKSRPQPTEPSHRAPRGRGDDFYGGPVPEQPPPRRHHHRHKRPHRHRENSRYPLPPHHPHHPHRRPPAAPRSELAAALDSLSLELGRTAATIRRLAGRRRPHRHRDGRCDVYEGLRESAGRLEGELDKVRAAGNNIGNLGEVLPLGRRTWISGGGGVRGGGGEEVPPTTGSGEGEGKGQGKREGSWVRTRPAAGTRGEGYVRTRGVEKGDGGCVRSGEGRDGKGRTSDGRKVRVTDDEDRGRKGARSG